MGTITHWSTVFRNLVLGQGCLGYLTGLTPLPTDSYIKMGYKKAQVLTWLHNSVEPSIDMNFYKFPTTHKVWDYL
ncbi:unnamed protein product [Camellia sinensis]